MAEVGVTRTDEKTVALTILVPVSAFESAGLAVTAQAAEPTPSPSPGNAEPPSPPAAPAEPPEPGEPGHPLGPSGTQDLSPPSEGNNPPGQDTVEPPKAKRSRTAAKPKTSRSRSRSTASKRK